MAITHVRYIHNQIPPEWSSQTFEDLEKDRHVLLVDMVSEGTETAPGKLYRDLDPSIKGSKDCVVLRGVMPHIREAVSGDPGLRREIGDRPVMALVGGTKRTGSSPSLVSLPGFSQITPRPRLEDLRQAELEALLTRTGAIFQHDLSHYVLPSKKHAERFIRLADALRSHHDVSRLVDWILSYVTRKTVVVADTGSLLPLLFHLREETARRFGWRLEIASLDEYPNNLAELTGATDAIRNRPEIAWMLTTSSVLKTRPKSLEEVLRFAQRTLRNWWRGLPISPTPPRFLFLVSVSSSGQLCQMLRELPIPGAQILVVCETAKEPEIARREGNRVATDDFLVRIPIDQWTAGDDGKCDHCHDEGKRIIRVDPVAYELIPPEYEPKCIPMTKERPEEKRDFWRFVHEAGAVQLHYDVNYSEEANRKRHFSVYLDTMKLSAHPEFRERCKTQLKSVKPDVILIPWHSHSDMVRDLCWEAYGQQIQHFYVTSARFGADVEAALSRARMILVADDAIVTGTTLRNLRAEVFRVTQLRNQTPGLLEVNAFVLVCRPSNHEPVKDIKRIYSGGAVKSVLSGDSLFLPSGQKCPWCKEMQLLDRFADRLQGESRKQAADRVTKLGSGPIRPPLLMVQDEHAHDGLITHQSLFGNLDHVTAFAAGSCASQKLKLELGTNGGVQLFVVETGMAIGSYYESPLLASMLRTFDRIDARYKAVDHIVEAKIESINPNQAYAGLLADLTLAAIAGKVPGKKLRELLETWKKDDKWLQMLADLYDVIGPT